MVQSLSRSSSPRRFQTADEEGGDLAQGQIFQRPELIRLSRLNPTLRCRPLTSGVVLEPKHISSLFRFNKEYFYSVTRANVTARMAVG